MIEYFDTSFIQATICIAKKLLINKLQIYIYNFVYGDIFHSFVF